jgi:hypothetical protein
MEIQEAIKVIRALADGLNPETRELLKRRFDLPESASRYGIEPCFSRAGHTAGEGTQPAGECGQYWSRAEDKQICEELHKGMNFEEIAKTHNRTVPSIIVRLVKLGQIAPNKSGSLFPPQVA